MASRRSAKVVRRGAVTGAIFQIVFPAQPCDLALIEPRDAISHQRPRLDMTDTRPANRLKTKTASATIQSL